jgi:diaminohydroxyphosphoribosylaminopyrimidine deaminase/5-amino-6-(5-phosphoribosylamino)uracil reductase
MVVRDFRETRNKLLRAVLFGVFARESRSVGAIGDNGGMFNETDHHWMQRALDLAARGLLSTTPNPRVGCVIVREGAVVGEGWHLKAGEAHAETLALAQAGDRARGATAYVTLEPCSHFGRTPPCTDALVKARLARVIVAMEDPNPLVNGQGLDRLRSAGIDVRCGLLEAQARELNIGFVSRMTRGRPWVRLKVAASLDGYTALPDGSSQWITSEAARNDGHNWRARSCAILTGIGTVREDDPMMTARAPQAERQPLKVLVDSRLEVDPQARILKSGRVLIAAADDLAGRAQALRDRGCELSFLPDARHKVDLSALMQELGARGINELHVEAGFKLNGSLLREGLVDELLVYTAPSLLGGGRPMFDLPVVDRLDDRLQWVLHAVDQVGPDLRLLARAKPKSS